MISSRIIVGGRTFAMDGDLALRACVDAYFPPPPLHLLNVSIQLWHGQGSYMYFADCGQYNLLAVGL